MKIKIPTLEVFQYGSLDVARSLPMYWTSIGFITPFACWINLVSLEALKNKGLEMLTFLEEK